MEPSDKEYIALHTVERAAEVLIHLLCLDTNATKATCTINGLTYKDEPIGDWEIIVRKKK